MAETGSRETAVSTGATRRATASIGRAVRRGIEAYDRVRMLPRLLPVSVEDLVHGPLSARNPATTREIIARLEVALRRERANARAGHWTYDLNRHIGLVQAWRAERRRYRMCG
jgi:hypothetical protein